MAKLTPAAFATWVLKHIEADTWLSVLTLQRRLAGINGHRFTAAGLLGALKRAGWVEQHPTMPGIYAISSRCWLSEKQKPALSANEGRPFSQ